MVGVRESREATLAGDFNGDGTRDILWFNSANGGVDIWKMAHGT